MSSFNMFFVINNNKELEINRLEVKKIPEYKVLFDRDKGSEKDSIGKKSLIACGELYYIYLLYDVRSPYYNLPENERKLKAKKDANLPSNWREDEKFEIASIRYREDFKLSSTGNAYAVAERAFYAMSEDTNIMLDNILKYKQEAQKKLVKLETKVPKGDMETIQLINEYSAIISNCVKLQKDIIGNIKDFKGLNQMVKDLAITFSEEGGNLKVVVGGGTVGNREN